MTNYILQYDEAIRSGAVTVGKWVRLLYEYITEGLRKKSFYYDEKKAQRAITFIEKFCRHHEGELGGQLIKLELWQKAFISVLFGIVDREGVRQFTEVLLVMARKNGKTLLASARDWPLGHAGDEGPHLGDDGGVSGWFSSGGPRVRFLTR